MTANDYFCAQKEFVFLLIYPKHLFTMHKYLLRFAVSALLLVPAATSAQTGVTPFSGASNAVATPVPHTTVPFRIADAGEKLPDIRWGLDLAWISESNLRRGVQFAGQDMIDIVRLSFQTTHSVADGALSDDQKSVLNRRIGYVKKWAPNAAINLNSDQEAGVDSWYNSSRGTRWAQLIKLTKQHVETAGLKVESVSPFNEPDYTAWKQGSKADFLAICKNIKADPAMAGVLTCGGNTLNDDQAADWYNYCKSALDIGNTHQLAGSFDKFAAFYQQVAVDGKIGMADELHNTMEAMIASNYGLGQAIWWGTCEHTRSQWMKASRGTRLGYAENRSRWTAASVYRHPSTAVHPAGYVQGFGGSSERQANPTDFRFVALDHDVWYDGVGPTREYFMQMPGGTGYQQGQTNAEGLVNIQDGEDIMPAIQNGTYRLVNRFSGCYLAPAGGTLSNGAALTQVKTAYNTVRWNLRRVPRDRGGDFSYVTLRNAADTTYVPDLLDWTLDNQGAVVAYRGGLGDNELWYLEYAEDGYFYIKSKHSGFCLDIQQGSDTQMKATNRAVVQAPCTGAESQQWRLIPGDASFNSVAPQMPAGLTATPQPGSIRLDWTPGKKEVDMQHFVVLRSTDQQVWNTIARVPASKRVSTDDAFAYVDNTALPATTYYYKVQAQDLSQNRSEATAPVQAAATDERACIMQLCMEQSLADTTVNGNHAALFGTPTYDEGRVGKAVGLDGSQFLQLPATVAASEELTVCGWFYLTGIQNWARLFDFGTDTDHYVFLTAQSGSGPRLAIKNGGAEQTMALGATISTRRWRHVAVSFGADAITIYVDGKQVARNTSIQERPHHFQPVFNYVGRSQFSADPMLKALVDDVRVYNYALTADELAGIYDSAVGIRSIEAPQTSASEAGAQATGSGAVYSVSGQRLSRPARGIVVSEGRKWAVSD